MVKYIYGLTFVCFFSCTSDNIESNNEIVFVYHPLKNCPIEIDSLILKDLQTFIKDTIFELDVFVMKLLKQETLEENEGKMDLFVQVNKATYYKCSVGASRQVRLENGRTEVGVTSYYYELDSNLNITSRREDHKHTGH